MGLAQTMTELTFLVDLLLNHKLPKPTRQAVANRIKEVEESFARVPSNSPRFSVTPMAAPVAIPSHLVGQSPSTIAAMMRQEQAGGLVSTPLPHVDMGDAIPAHPTIGQAPPPQPVTVIAQTPMAAAAMAERHAAIIQGISGKPEKGRTSPRKF